MFVSELTNLIAKSKNMKKESLSIIMAKILLAAIIFVEAGVVVLILQNLSKIFRSFRLFFWFAGEGVGKLNDN